MAIENDHSCECSVCAERYAQLRCSAGNVDAAKALELATKLDYARHSRITHGVRVDLDYQEMDLARDALRIAAQSQEVQELVNAALEASAKLVEGAQNAIDERLLAGFEGWRDGANRAVFAHAIRSLKNTPALSRPQRATDGN